MFRLWLILFIWFLILILWFDLIEGCTPLLIKIWSMTCVILNREISGKLNVEKNEKEWKNTIILKFEILHSIVLWTYYLCFKPKFISWLSSQWIQQCFLSPLHPRCPTVRYNTGHICLIHMIMLPFKKLVKKI